MKRFKVIVVTILFLWVLAYLISFLIGSGFENVTGGIAIVPLHGMITLSDSQDLFGVRSVGSESVLLNLRKAAENKAVKAVILEINSGGGTVVASKEIADYIRELREIKPVIAWIREVGASGAYWVASNADVIVADELSITGSIGVISSYLEYSGLMEKYGVKYERLVAGEYKDLGAPYKELGADEKIILQNKLDKIQKVFVEEVRKNRNLNLAQVSEIKKGAFYLGMEAKDLGLVDFLGGKNTAVAKAQELGNVSDGGLVEYKTKKNILDLLEMFSERLFFNMGRGIGSELVLGEEFKISA